MFTGVTVITGITKLYMSFVSHVEQTREFSSKSQVSPELKKIHLENLALLLQLLTSGASKSIVNFTPAPSVPYQ